MIEEKEGERAKKGGGGGWGRKKKLGGKEDALTRRRSNQTKKKKILNYPAKQKKKGQRQSNIYAVRPAGEGGVQEGEQHPLGTKLKQRVFFSLLRDGSTGWEGTFSV